MKKIIILLFLCNCVILRAQTILPQVINSAGDYRPIGSTGMSLADNVGEPFTETIGPAGNVMITQGFLQPDLITTLGPSASVFKNDVSCSDKKDGNISVSLSNLSSDFVVTYSWSPSSVCPAGNCSGVDSLSPGTYSLVITVTNTVTSKTQTIVPNPITINDVNGPCHVKIYNAVTANGDGENDTWTIDNITDFPNNHVSIFNRWGLKVFETNNYDNAKNAWPQKDEVSKLVPSTYFYVLNLGNGTVLKGWIELIKN